MVKYNKRNKLVGTAIQVNHSEFGTLFSALICGEGSLIDTCDDEGFDIPFLTTDQILNQLRMFGFDIIYDYKKDLPDNVFVFLKEIMLLGYDKITKVMLETYSPDGENIWKPTVVVFKSTKDNDDLLSFGHQLGRRSYINKIDDNSILNVTYEEEMNWDWVTSFFNIADILDENLDHPVDQFVNGYESDFNSGTSTELNSIDNDGMSIYTEPDSSEEQPVDPSNFTPYYSEEDDSEEDNES